MLRRHKYPLILLILAALLVALRAALPEIVERQVNARLHALDAYEGSVEDIDLALWRGGYRIDGLRIVKKHGAQQRPFFSAKAIEFSIEWPNLLRGALVAEGVFHSPSLNLVQAPDEQRTQLGDEEDWTKRLREFFPFRINTLEIREGTVTFLAPGIAARDALSVQHVHGSLVNLTNVARTSEEAFARFGLQGRVLGGAPLRVTGRIDPSAAQPAFEVDLTLERVQLTQVNPWLLQYIKAKADHGDFQLYLEVAAADGRFEGYAKPLMQNVEIGRTKAAERSVLRGLWEGVVDFATEALDNEQTDQVGARVPFSGKIENPDADIVATIVSVLRNAFVSAFARSLEGSVGVREVKEDLSKYSEPER